MQHLEYQLILIPIQYKKKSIQANYYLVCPPWTWMTASICLASIYRASSGNLVSFVPRPAVLIFFQSRDWWCMLILLQVLQQIIKFFEWIKIRWAARPPFEPYGAVIFMLSLYILFRLRHIVAKEMIFFHDFQKTTFLHFLSPFLNKLTENSGIAVDLKKIWCRLRTLPRKDHNSQSWFILVLAVAILLS